MNSDDPYPQGRWETSVFSDLECHDADIARYHLTSMNGAAVQIVYDGDGNRVKKIANGATTQYLVDDLNPTGYPQVAEELTSGAVSRTYTYGLQRISQNQLISSTWTPSFYGYDGLGTVRQLTSTTGAITDTYDYDAFGNKINSTGTTPNNYLYRGWPRSRF
jgi:hypothetical protein